MSLAPGQAFAPMLIGTLGNAILLGVSAVQTFFYFQNYKGDLWWFKCLVAYLMVAGVVNTGCDIALIYEPLITRYGSTVPISPKFLPADSAVTALVSTPVQLFMAWRIKVMSQSLLITTIIAIFSLCSLAGGLWLASGVIVHPFFQQEGTRLSDAAIVWLFGSAVTDILLTGTIVFILVRKRRRHRTALNSDLNSYISRIIRNSIESGALTTTAVLADIIVFLVLPNTTYFFIWDFTLAKLYTISLLASLNARRLGSDSSDTGPRAQNALFPNSTFNSNSMLPTTSKRSGPDLNSVSPDTTRPTSSELDNLNLNSVEMLKMGSETPMQPSSTARWSSSLSSTHGPLSPPTQSILDIAQKSSTNTVDHNMVIPPKTMAASRSQHHISYWAPRESEDNYTYGYAVSS